jgi:hypothetical protein
MVGTLYGQDITFSGDIFLAQEQANLHSQEAQRRIQFGKFFGNLNYQAR